MSKSTCYDACILGGGIIGLTLAVEAVRRGQSVILCEAKSLGYGASGAGSGILMTHGATKFHSLFREFYVRSINEFYPKWIDFLNESQADLTNFQELKMRRTGSWQFYSQDSKYQSLLGQLDREESRNYETLDELPEYFDSFLNREILTQGVSFKDECIIHNGELIKSLTHYLEQSPLATIETGRNFDFQWNQSDQTWIFDGLKVKRMILSSGAWVDDVLRPLGFESRMVPVRGQLAYYESPSIQLERSIHMDGHFYAIPRESGFILGATTEAREWDQSFQTSGAHYLKEQIQRYFQEPFHQLEPVRAWAGLRPRSRDRKPLMGLVDESKNLWMSAGHYKNGLSMAPMAAELLWQKILGDTCDLDVDEFSPLRQKGLVPL